MSTTANNKEAVELFRLAKELYNDAGHIEIDIPETEDEAEERISRNTDGAWVRAWVYIAYDQSKTN